MSAYPTSCGGVDAWRDCPRPPSPEPQMIPIAGACLLKKGAAAARRQVAASWAFSKLISIVFILNIALS